MLYLLFLLSSLTLFAGDFQKVDQIVSLGIKARSLPGANLSIGTSSDILKMSSYGKKDSLQKNSLETIYDVASLTKVIATTPAIMILIKQGKVSLTDKVSAFFPDFTGGEKNLVTIEDLLRHEAGLLSGINVLSGESYANYLYRILITPLSYKPRSKSVYSDLSFILLGAIVEQVSGESLGNFCARAIFSPLKMNHTFFKVPGDLKTSCAPTIKERFCLPHDPKAFALYPSELGHAGVFSTINDLSRFAMMILNKGELEGVRILSKDLVSQMQTLKSGHMRGLGWDLLSEYSTAPRGEVFPQGISFGHTGYTGATLWIDPKSETFYAFLSNRVFLGETNTAKPFSALRKDLSTEIGKIIYGRSSPSARKKR